MDSLRLLLVQNQNNLDRLRARARYLKNLIFSSNYDTHKQYGPYADFWDEWYEQMQIIFTDLKSDIRATEEFVAELREFIFCIEVEKRPARGYKKRLSEMNSLSLEAIACQHDMLHIADTQLAEHKEFTHKLLLVEAIDSLNED